MYFEAEFLISHTTLVALRLLLLLRTKSNPEAFLERFYTLIVGVNFRTGVMLVF